MVEALIISLIILFIHACSWEGMIFEGIKKLVSPDVDDKKGSVIYKPLYGCPICMTPWWGSFIYWIIFHISFLHWVVVVGAACGLSVIWVLLIDIKDNLKQKQNGK